jgi:hypothetical protein
MAWHSKKPERLRAPVFAVYRLDTAVAIDA